MAFTVTNACAGHRGPREGDKSVERHSEQISRTELLIAVVGLWTILIALIVSFCCTRGGVLEEDNILPITRRPSWVRDQPFPGNDWRGPAMRTGGLASPSAFTG